MSQHPIEAMKQALEALEQDNPLGRSATITALRTAIAEAEKQEPVAWRYALDASVEGPRWIYIDKDPHQWLKGPAMVMAVIEPLYTTPPGAPVQDERDWSLLEATQESLREHMAEIKRLKAIIEAAEKQEPVGEIRWAGNVPNSLREVVWFDYVSPPIGTKLYTTPQPQREWVGLTDEEIAKVCGFGQFTSYSTQLTLSAVARAIEAKLKEKNT